jgi:thiol:disulfide interchange protein
MRRASSILLAAVLLLACGGRSEEGLPASPEARAPSLDDDPYAERSEEELGEAIAAARRHAAATDRRVLLEFVADWCADCREVVRLGREMPARRVLEEGYVTVYVDVGDWDRHAALREAHGITRIAALVVLDPASGERVAMTTMEPITGDERGLTSDGLAAWLRAPSGG